MTTTLEHYAGMAGGDLACLQTKATLAESFPGGMVNYENGQSDQIGPASTPEQNSGKLMSICLISL